MIPSLLPCGKINKMNRLLTRSEGERDQLLFDVQAILDTGRKF